MGLVKGLKNITKYLDDEEAKFANRDATKATWFKLADKQAVTVQFLQELDEDSPHYSEKNGLGFLAVEHSHPVNWKNTARCTILPEDGGQCWACEQHQKDFKAGWRPKNRLYVNVLVDDGVEDPYVAILAQGNGPRSITPVLIEIAGDLGTITDTLFKVKRSGKGKSDTQYVLTQRGKTDNDTEQYELFDLDKAARKIPYEEQQEFYTKVYGESSGETDEKNLVDANTESEW